MGILKEYRDNDLGFCILELLIVLSIVSVLAACLLPSVQRQVEADRRMKCAGNLKSIAAASFLYAGDNGGLLPSSCPDQLATRRIRLGSGEHTGAGRLLENGYLNDPGLLACPSSSYMRPAVVKRGYMEEGKKVKSSYLYRAGSGGSDLRLSKANPALFTDFNLRGFGLYNHGGNFINIAFRDGSVEGFTDDEGNFILHEKFSVFVDNLFREADGLYSKIKD